jgi:hypothetical protein
MPDVENSMLMVTADLATAGSTVNQTAVTLVGHLSDLKTKLDTLITGIAGDPGWSGVSFDFYATDKAQWDAASLALFGDTGNGGLLGQISNMLNVNYENYVGAETSCTKSWQIA